MVAGGGGDGARRRWRRAPPRVVRRGHPPRSRQPHARRRPQAARRQGHHLVHVQHAARRLWRLQRRRQPRHPLPAARIHLIQHEHKQAAGSAASRIETDCQPRELARPTASDLTVNWEFSRPSPAAGAARKAICEAVCDCPLVPSRRAHEPALNAARVIAPKRDDVLHGPSRSPEIQHLAPNRTVTESHLLGVCSATDAEQNGVLLGLPPAPTHRHGGRAGGQHPSESKPNRRPVEATNAARWLSFVLATLARDHLVVSAVSKMRNRMAGACVVLQQGLAEGLSSET